MKRPNAQKLLLDGAPIDYDTGKTKKLRRGNRTLNASAAAADTAFVEFDQVQKSYDGVTLVVKNLNLNIGKGEFLTMLGPSGSGKTT